MYKALTVILIVYAVFTTGIVYEVSGMNNTANIEVPYSMGISGERTGLSNMVNQDDIACAKWVIANRTGQKIAVDYNGILLLRSYFPANINLSERLIRWEYGVPNNVLVFCSSWNSRNKQYVVGSSLGLRVKVDINYTGLIEIYRIGDSVVYEKETSNGHSR